MVIDGGQVFDEDVVASLPRRVGLVSVHGYLLDL
jgi:hypothetical protein